MGSIKKHLVICLSATLLAYCVIVLGAYTRLSDAGLGCPDWPGCYGNLIVPGDDARVEKANAAYPQRPLDNAKAWKEMVHRYAAGALGLLILYLAVHSVLARKKQAASPLAIPLALLALVIFQAALGMWTVTLLLKPVVVSAHLLGGMTILALLYWLVLRAAFPAASNGHSSLNRLAIVGIVVLAAQIALGGWTSANYSALACVDFPTCQGKWWPQMDFQQGFVLWRGTGIDYEGGVLDMPARTAIHVTHRLGALVSFLILASIALLALFSGKRRLKRCGLFLFLVLLAQVGLGIANVLLVLPLPVAVAHNGGAALLLLALLTLLYFSRMRQPDKVN